MRAHSRRFKSPRQLIAAVSISVLAAIPVICMASPPFCGYYVPYDFDSCSDHKIPLNDRPPYKMPPLCPGTRPGAKPVPPKPKAPENPGANPNAQPAQTTPGAQNSDKCPTCSSTGQHGMPEWSIEEPSISLELEDSPLGYEPARGLPLDFHLSYRQRGAITEDATIFSVGPNWSCSFRAFLVDMGGGILRLHCGSAGLVDYTNGTPQYQDGSILTQLASGGYQIEYAGGAQETFTNMFTSGARTCYALATQSDSAGNTTAYTYTNSAGFLQLLAVSDPDTNTTLLYYESPSGANLVTRVVDPWGRTALLTYDENGFLTNVVDVANLTNSFTYDPTLLGQTAWITSMTTPYGTTSFSFGGVDLHNGDPTTDTNIPNRFVTVTLPTGGHHLFVYQHDCTNLVSNTYSPSPDTSPLGNTLDNVDQENRNSFHWDPLQYSHLSTTDPNSLTVPDYNLGRLHHWLVDAWATTGAPSSTLSLERLPTPDGTATGQITWFDYDGKARGNNYSGTNGLPSLVALVLPDSAGTRYTHYARNAHDYIT